MRNNKRRKRAGITVERTMACDRGQRQKGVAGPPQLHSSKCHSLDKHQTAWQACLLPVCAHSSALTVTYCLKAAFSAIGKRCPSWNKQARDVIQVHITSVRSSSLNPSPIYSCTSHGVLQWPSGLQESFQTSALWDLNTFFPSNLVEI